MDDYYSERAEYLLERYEKVKFESVHGDVLPFIMGLTGSALDIGCGSGRDSAWLARQGWSVVAIDPSVAMLAGAKLLHAEPNIEWLNDRLPKLVQVQKLQRKFQFVLCSAVWMHIPVEQQSKAAETVSHLLALGGILNLSVRTGGEESSRAFHSVDFERAIAAFSTHGLGVLNDAIDKDLLGRMDVVWRKLTLKKLC